MRNLSLFVVWLALALLGGCQSVDPHPAQPDLAAPFTCYGCHQNQYTATTLPAHQSLGLSTTCEECHTNVAWKPAKGFAHDAFWPLTGAHATVACAKCHADPALKPPKACIGCHQANYDATTAPNHKLSGTPTTCEGCHSTAAWKPAVLNHDLFYPLVGKHQTAACAACHVDPALKPPKVCAGCHQAQYDTATAPNHKVTGIPTACETCHTPVAWKPATFDHAKYYPLVGKHQAAACTGCHTALGVKPAKTCVTCHLVDYDATTTPNHKVDGMSKACEACHTPVGWKPANLDHDPFYPLTGKHKTAQCAGCHKTQGVAPPKTCAGCHQANYDATTAPNHKVDGIPTTCESCHSTAAWKPATLNHDLFYPLTGKHKTVDCTACHQTQGDKPPKTCAGCHKAKYDGTTNPNHAGAGLSTACETCHTTAGWSPASFEHSKYWVLTGKHTATACGACHKTPGVKLPTDCNGCHQADFKAASNPNHVTLGLPTACTTCHTTSAWTPAAFPSHKFPISSGKHKLACLTCHTTPSNFKLFACSTAGCHSVSNTNSKHKGVSGYSSAPTACVKCHPNGKGD